MLLCRLKNTLPKDWRTIILQTFFWMKLTIHKSHAIFFTLSTILTDDYSIAPLNYRNFLVVVVSNTFINTNVPIFRHHIASQTETNIKKQKKLTWASIFFIHILNWREFKLVRAVSKFTWHLFHKCSLSLHLGDLQSQLKSLEGEQ